MVVSCSAADSMAVSKAWAPIAAAFTGSVVACASRRARFWARWMSSSSRVTDTSATM